MLKRSLQNEMRQSLKVRNAHLRFGGCSPAFRELSSLGTSIANVGVPTLAQAFNASFQEVQWIVLAYLLSAKGRSFAKYGKVGLEHTTLIVSVGRLGDITGRRRPLLPESFCSQSAVTSPHRSQ